MQPLELFEKKRNNYWKDQQARVIHQAQLDCSESKQNPNIPGDDRWKEEGRPAMGGRSPEMGLAGGGEAGRQRWRRPVVEREKAERAYLGFMFILIITHYTHPSTI